MNRRLVLLNDSFVSGGCLLEEASANITDSPSASQEDGARMGVTSAGAIGNVNNVQKKRYHWETNYTCCEMSFCTAWWRMREVKQGRQQMATATHQHQPRVITRVRC